VRAIDALIAAGGAQQLPGVLQSLAPTLDRYGYLAVLVLVLVEDFGIPVPGETVLILGSAYAGAGRLNIALVVLLAWLGAVLGDNIGFAVGHHGGRRLVERYGRYVFLTPERIDKATNFFDRHGGKVIVVARFVEGLRQANGIIAGTTGMRWQRFLMFNALGAALWVGAWASVGYFSGNHLNTVYDDATRYDAYLGCGFAALLVAYLVWRRVRRGPARVAMRDRHGEHDG